MAAAMWKKNGVAGNSEEVLWRDCSHWLVRCGVLPSGHRVVSSDAEIFDLAQTLRDGVLLCHLVNSLHKNSVDLKDVSLRPQMSQFLCLKNIRAFLQASQTVFRLGAADLFDSCDLFDVSNFEKVLQTLSRLSKTPVAQKKVAGGFPQDDDTFNHDSSIYQHLEELATVYDDGDMWELDAALGDADSSWQPGVHHEVQDEIYKDLCEMRRFRNSWQSLTKPPVEKRDHIIKELVETEKSYVDALHMVIVHFYRRLNNILTPEEREDLFKHYQDLYEIHTAFQSDLQRSYTQGSPPLSECFLKFRDKFPIYGDYCSNLPRAQQLVDDVCARSQLVRVTILECQERANEGRFKLRDLLTVPMQRVLKYNLLLKTLLKETPDSNEDKVGLQNALDAMLDLSLYINEVKRDNETLDIIAKIEKSIQDLQMPENTELKHYGRLIKDGELKIKAHCERDSKPKQRYCFLFDKVMLMCRSLRGEVYTYKDAILLNKYTIEDQKENLTKANKDKYNWCFRLVERDRRSVLDIYTKTDDVKRKWLDAISLAQDNDNPRDCHRTDHTLMMYTWDAPTYCTVCQKLLRGTFYQGYRCSSKRCDAKVHKECIRSSRCGKRVNAFSSHSGPPPVPPRNKKVEAVRSFRDNSSPQHLHFRSGDVIQVTSAENDASGWLQGRLERTGQEGTFPSTHVSDIRNSTVENGTAGVSNNHANTSLENQPWYVNVMRREDAEKKLENLPTGTFLVRVTPKQNCGYAISVKYNSHVKHILVRLAEDDRYYVSDSNIFSSIPELVTYFQENSLNESFKDLNTTLLLPYKSQVKSTMHGPIGYCVAKYPYAARQMNMLSFDRGDRIAVLSKAGEERGWWKGELNGKVGYFPKSYVHEEENHEVVRKPLSDMKIIQS